MKKSVKKYVGWGATIIITGALILLIFFCIYRFSLLAAGIKKLIGILMPIIVGIAIAYILAPAYHWLRRRLIRLLRNTFHWHGRKSIRCAGILAMTGTFVGAGALIAGLLALIIPQIVDSVTSFSTSLPSNMMNLSQTLQNLLESNPELETNAMSLYAQAVNYIEQWIQTSFSTFMQDVLGYLSVGVMSTVTFVKNFLIGLIIAIYLLAGQDRFLRQLTRCVYAVFDAHWGNIILGYTRYANQVFTGFISGKLVDSFIIFLICCVILPIMNIPYAMLVSVIVGVTNIIPFFGPFIGAIPSLAIIAIENPLKALYFLIYILILQQFDGNILGPKILGNSTGLSSFWVLFAILLFGGLFGFIGMLLGVPVFAVLYHVFTDVLNRALRKKNLPDTVVDYAWLDHIDEETYQAVHRSPVRTEPSEQESEPEPEQSEQTDTDKSQQQQ